MYKYITEAVLYNSCGCEIDRETLNDLDLSGSLAKVVRGWSIGEGDTIKIESRMIKYY